MGSAHMTLSAMVIEVELAVELCGGATSSIFPQVEALLLSDTNAQAALRFVSEGKKVDSYRSMMDFLFCETFREYRTRCQRFYAGEGPSLSEILSSDLPQWRYYNRVLLAAIHFATVVARRGSSIPWCGFVATIKKAVRESGC